jgi:type IV pilus assembly protein PilB
MKLATGFGHRRRTLGKLGERLLAAGVISDDQLRQALEFQKQNGGFVGEVLVSLGFVTAGAMKPYLEEATGFPFVEISEEEIDPDVYHQFSEAMVVARRALPYREVDGSIYVAMADPLNLTIVDEFKAATDKPIVPCLAFSGELDEVIKRAYDVRYKTRTLLEEIAPVGEAEVDATANLLDQAEQAPIVRLVKNIITSAVSLGASDIHIEPQGNNIRVRYRIDGIMYEQMTFPVAHHAACVSRLKILAGMDIGERRRPQDGRFTTEVESGKAYDVRLSLMPTAHGEKACMRLLEKANSLARVDKIGLFPDQRSVFEKFIKRPHGLVLVTGPTGSGKTTTLYAALQSINDSTKNINTVEDPIEYTLPGINQLQVNQKLGVNFATGLRTLVRQDPDVILVGEIRDAETAEIAVQAALTGHLVLSTLHTNDAAGALIRLQNMGVEPFLISSSVVGVLAQRLARMLCPHCVTTYAPSREEAAALGLDFDGPSPLPQLARARGCKRCGNRGTRGRTAIIEILPMSDELRRLVLTSDSGDVLNRQAVKEGFISMRQRAVQRVLEHAISFEEMIRVFAELE